MESNSTLDRDIRQFFFFFFFFFRSRKRSHSVYLPSSIPVKRYFDIRLKNIPGPRDDRDFS